MLHDLCKLIFGTMEIDGDKKKTLQVVQAAEELLVALEDHPL